MKKLVMVAALVVCAGASAFAQGQIQFNNRVTSGTDAIVALIYNPQTASPSVRTSGQATNGVPAGTTTYTGGGVVGTGFTAQLWAGTNGAPESSLSAVVDPAGTTVFRTGGFAGAVVATTPTIVGVAPGQNAALQIRVWDNRNNTVTTWAQALALSGETLGKSDVFNTALGGGVLTPTTMLGLTSFSLTTPVPEPTTIALGVLGVGALLLRRRK